MGRSLDSPPHIKDVTYPKIAFWAMMFLRPEEESSFWGILPHHTLRYMEDSSTHSKMIMMLQSIYAHTSMKFGSV